MGEVAKDIARITVTYAAFTLLEGHESDATEGASWEASTEAFERGVRALLMRAYPSARIDVIPSPDLETVQVVARQTVPRSAVADIEARARDRITELVWEYRGRGEWISEDW